MARVKFIRGKKENLPSAKEDGAFYYAKDTGQFWVNGTELIREPLAEGTDGQVLGTDGNGTRSWISVNASLSRYPSPTNKQIAPKYTSVDDLGLTPSTLFSNSVDGNTSRTARRIPALLVLSDSTYIAACEARSSITDSSQIDIMFAKKTPTATSWTYETIHTYSSYTQVKYMNPSLCVDRNGDEQLNRIYLFCMAFTITNSNNGSWASLAGTEVDNYYVYSDDNGDSWSSVQKIGTNWGDGWKYSTISCNNSIFMSDGTLVCPCMGFNTSGYQHSGIVYKKKGETTWTYSPPSPVNGENECTVFENDGTLYIDVRNTSGERRIYTYDFDNDEFVFFDNSFVPNAICQAYVEEMTIDSVHMYTMSFVDTNSTERQNPTVWVSADGVMYAKAIKLYDGVVGGSAGYCMCSSYNNYVIAAYERDGVIYFIDLTEKRDILENTASYLTLGDQYRIEVSKEERYGALRYLFTAAGTSESQDTKKEYIDLTSSASFGSNNYAMNISTGSRSSRASNWKYLYVDVTEYRGMTLTVSVSNYNTTYGYGITASSYSTSNNSFIKSGVGDGSGYTVEEVEVVIPDTAVTLYVNYIYTGTYQYIPTVKVLKK